VRFPQDLCSSGKLDILLSLNCTVGGFSFGWVILPDHVFNLELEHGVKFFVVSFV